MFEPALSLSLRNSGAAFIKLSQWAATRPDLLPRTMCDALARLHSGAPSHSWHVTRTEVESALGSRIDETFLSFDRAPVASGSIGQGE